MAEVAETDRWLVDPKVTRVAFWMVHALGVLQFIGAGALLLYGASLAEWALAGILALGGLLFLAVAGILGARKGGVLFRGEGGAVRVFGRSAADLLEIPATEIVGLRVIRRQEFWGREASPVFVCSVELARKSGTTLLLLEFPDMEAAEDAALTFREVTGWDILTEPVPPLQRSAPPAASGVEVAQRSGGIAVTLRPGVRYALSLVTVSLAAFSVVTGGLMLLAVESTGVAGFLFGPFLGALGVCCMLLWLFHVLGGQRLELKSGRAWVYLFLAKWRPGRSDMGWVAGKSRARLRTRGALGFSLELVSGGHILSVGPGCTCGSAVGPDALVGLGDYLLANSERV